MIVFDFETDGINTDLNSIVQIAAIPIDMRNLTILDKETFNIDVCPINFKNEDYTEAHLDTILWHAKNYNCEQNDILERWKKGLSPTDAVKEFTEYCNSYATGRSYDKMPVCGGYNIEGFDIPILNRYCSKFSKKYPFHRRDTFDLLPMVRHWFLFSENPSKDYKFDTLRERFNLSTEQAHDALFDVQQTAELLIKFLRLYKTMTSKIASLR